MRNKYEDAALLAGMFTFNAESGRLFHAKDKRGGNGCIVAKAGTPADSYIGNRGYRVASFVADGKERKLLAHRVLYTLAHGSIPVGMVIDHINGERADNRLCNLRVLTRQQNDQNRTRVRGCDWYKPRRLWRARITVEGKEVRLGFFTTEEEARARYLEAKAFYHSYALKTLTESPSIH